MTARGRKRAEGAVVSLDAILAALGGRWRVETGPGWAMVHGDCLEVMAAMPDGCVGVTVEDPPYDVKTHQSGRRGCTGFREAATSRRAEFNRNRDLGFEAITDEQMATTAAQVARVTRRWSLTFCALEQAMDWRHSFDVVGAEYVRTMAWRKIGCTPQFTGDRPAMAMETIVVVHPPGRKRWNGGGRHGWYDVEDTDDLPLVYDEPIVLNRGGNADRLHTTQKPLPLMERIVADFTDHDDLVLDAYAGSATCGVACLRLGRSFLGIERDPAYFEIACRRMRGDEAKPRPEQPSLFQGVSP